MSPDPPRQVASDVAATTMTMTAREETSRQPCTRLPPLGGDEAGISRIGINFGERLRGGQFRRPSPLLVGQRLQLCDSIDRIIDIERRCTADLRRHDQQRAFDHGVRLAHLPPNARAPCKTQLGTTGAFRGDLAGGLTGGQRFFPVQQVRIFRTFSPPLGGHGDRHRVNFSFEALGRTKS